MTQKLLKVGSSAAVTIPKKSLKDLGLKIGDEVAVEVDTSRQTVVIKPIVGLSERDVKIAELTFHFIQRYRKDLETLAKK